MSAYVGGGTQAGLVKRNFVHKSSPERFLFTFARTGSFASCFSVTAFSACTEDLKMRLSQVVLSSFNASKLDTGSSVIKNGLSTLNLKSYGIPRTEPRTVYETDDGAFVYTQGGMHDVARDILSKRLAEDEAFFVCDVRDIVKKVALWRECLPRIAPFYAIKACRDPVVLNVLHRHGVNFDCSNKSELRAVLNMGVTPDRIVYANTVKSPSDIDFAQRRGVRLMTFDSSEELIKIRDKHARLLLRIHGDERGSLHSFNNKFGCSLSDAKRLLEQALSIGCNVVGVSFHVGCAYQDTSIFTRTIEKAKAVFEAAANMGIHMNILDIGGGLPGGLRKGNKFLEVCRSIRLATDLHFPPSTGVQIIAEPGQFFVTSAYALAVQVIGKRRREVVVDGVTREHQDVFINETKDNCVSRNLYHHLDNKIWPLQEPLERPHDIVTTIWGGTCNPVDLIEDRKPFFDVDVGEWLLMDDIGAYSLSSATGFNGLPFPAVHYIVPDEDASFVCRILGASPLRSGYSQPEGVLKKSLLEEWRKQVAL